MGLEVFLHGLKVDVPIEHYTFEVVVPDRRNTTFAGLWSSSP